MALMTFQKKDFEADPMSVFLCFFLIHNDPFFQQATCPLSDKERSASSQVYNLWLVLRGRPSHTGPKLFSYQLGLMHHV